MSYKENIWAGVPPAKKSRAFFCWSTWSTTWPSFGKKSVKGAPNTASGDSQGHGPWTPFCADPFRVHRFRYLKGCGTSLWGEHVVVPNILPHRQQDECMRELHQECTWCMTRVGLQSETGLARPSFRNQRHSYNQSSSWAWTLSASPQGQSQLSKQEQTPW